MAGRPKLSQSASGSMPNVGFFGHSEIKFGAKKFISTLYFSLNCTLLITVNSHFSTVSENEISISHTIKVRATDRINKYYIRKTRKKLI